MIHITRFAHVLHNVSDYVRETNSTFENYIDNCEKIFNGWPSGLEVFKENTGNIPILPELVLTRWGTWLKNTEYHSDKFQKMAEIIYISDTNDTAKCVKETKNSIWNYSLILRCDLDYNSNEFKIFSFSITTLEKRNLEITKTVEMMEILINNYQSNRSNISKK